MRILLVGESPSSPYTAGSYARALGQLGLPHRVFDVGPYLEPRVACAPASLFWRVVSHVGRRARFVHHLHNRQLLAVAKHYQPHVVLVIKGQLITADTLSQLSAVTNSRVVNFLTDDPFNTRHADWHILPCVPLYDVVFTPRRESMGELEHIGARRVCYLQFGWDPEISYPERPLDNREQAKYSSDVVFVGNCDQDRLPVLTGLARAATRGNWQFAIFGRDTGRFSDLRPVWRGPVSGRSYRLALSGTRIALCLLRHANRDAHTMRTFEVPGCGAFMLAERTADHLRLFGEGEGAAMFGSDTELVDKIRYYLGRATERDAIAAEGRRRIVEGGHTYVHRLEEVLQVLG